MLPTCKYFEMKKIIFITIYSLCLFAVHGQDYYFINAKSGLNVRSSSDLSSPKVAKIPFGMLVEKIEDTKKELTIIDNGKQIKGKFVKIKYYNYPYLVSEETEANQCEGFVFDFYLKKRENDSLVSIKQIDKATYSQLLQKAFKDIKKPIVFRNLDSIKTILKNRVEWVTMFESDEHKREDVLKSITTENGQKLIFNQNSYDFGFSEGYSGYYPEYDILVLEGGHSIDVCFSIKTGETEATIGNPEYIISSPENSYRINGVFGGQECISYFFQKKEYGKFIYLTELNWDYDVCVFKSFYWISETSFIYVLGNHFTEAIDGTEAYYRGDIKNN
jgi:hypothetical protein